MKPLLETIWISVLDESLPKAPQILTLLYHRMYSSNWWNCRWKKKLFQNFKFNYYSLIKGWCWVLFNTFYKFHVVFTVNAKSSTCEWYDRDLNASQSNQNDHQNNNSFSLSRKSWASLHVYPINIWLAMNEDYQISCPRCEKASIATTTRTRRLYKQAISCYN